MDANLKSSARTGDPAAHLRLRIRAGEVSEERARLAAHLGHSPAREALSLGPQTSSGLDEWVAGICAFGLEPVVRTAVAVSRSVLDTSCSLASSTLNLEAAEDWVHCPCNDHAAAAYGVAREGYLPLPQPLRPGVDVYVRGRGAHDACRISAELAGSPGIAPAELAPRLTLAIGRARTDSSEGDQVLTAMYSELVPWALGEGDPVTDRALPRQRIAALPPRERMQAQLDAGQLPVGCLVELDHTRMTDGFVLVCTGMTERKGPAPKKMTGLWMIGEHERGSDFVWVGRVSKRTHQPLKATTANSEMLLRSDVRRLMVKALVPKHLG